jgi:hypothetical protein
MTLLHPCVAVALCQHGKEEKDQTSQTARESKARGYEPAGIQNCKAVYELGFIFARSGNYG